VPLRGSQSLEEEPGCSWGGARVWGRSLGVLEEGPESGGGVGVFLGWSQSWGRSLDVPRVEPEPGLAKGPSLPGSATMRA